MRYRTTSVLQTNLELAGEFLNVRQDLFPSPLQSLELPLQPAGV